MDASGSAEHRQSAFALRNASSRTPAVANRLDYIDGLRALAALWVAAHHAIETSVPARALTLPVVGPVLGSLFFGQFPVMVFLMLSGFCLYYPYVRKNPGRPELSTGYRAFLVRRVTRIAPPYLWAGAFCLVLDAIPGIQIGRWKSVGPISTSVVLSHLLFVHNLIPGHATKIDYPMWSIGLEWQLYLLFPLLMWGFRRWNGPLVTGVALAIAALIRATYRGLPGLPATILHDGPFSYLEIFCAGMLVAAFTVQRLRLAPKGLLGCISAAGMIGIRVGSGNGLLHDLATSAAAFCILLLASDGSSFVSRVLCTPRLVRIGIFSYSIYLIHAPLLHLCWLALLPLHLPPDINFAFLVVVGLPLIIMLSFGFHCLFERPFMRVRPTTPPLEERRRGSVSG
jgi:peptidoglycan/LPS O-acetylase OafA/YrhL